jgi:hypothetical protein
VTLRVSDVEGARVALRSPSVEVELSCAGVILPPLRLGVQPDHALFVDRAGELLQRGDPLLRQREAVEEHGLVLREETEVVGQRDEIVLGDFRVSRVRVLHVDRAAPQRFVAETVVDPF